MIYQISRDSQTSSSCSECKRQNLNGDKHNHKHYESSNSSNGERSPRKIATNLLQKKQQNRVLFILRQQIRDLQKSNEEKDRAIRQLKEMANRKEKKTLHPQISRKTPEKQRQKVDIISNEQLQFGRLKSPKNLKRAEVETETNFRIVLLQKQIREFQIKVMQITNKLNESFQVIAWMQKFIISFTQMCEDLSLNYGEKLNLKGINLRKRTKICWKYLKQLINTLIK